MGPKVLAWNGLEGRTAGGKSPCGSTFSDHPMDNLTSQLQKKEIRRISKRILRLAVELLNKETHHRDVMSFFSVLSYQAARSYIEMNGLGYSYL